MAAVLQQSRTTPDSHTVCLAGRHELQFDRLSTQPGTLWLSASLLRPAGRHTDDFGARRLAFASYSQPDSGYASVRFRDGAIWLGSASFDLPEDAVAPLRAWLQATGVTIDGDQP